MTPKATGDPASRAGGRLWPYKSGTEVHMSELAERLLQLHARRPDHVFYGVDVLGSLYRDADVQRLDQAYAELVGSRYMEPAGVVVSYFGAPKALHRITSDGLSAAAQQSAA